MITAQQDTCQENTSISVQYPTELDLKVREEFGRYRAQGYLPDDDGPMLSMKLMASACQVNSSFIFFASLSSEWAEQEDLGHAQTRWKPTQNIAEYIKNPHGVYVKLSTAWMAKHIKENCPGAAHSRQAVRKIINSLIAVLGMKKGHKAQFQRWESCDYVAFPLDKALAAQRTLEAMYWETREKAESLGKKIVELPHHMFKFTKEMFQWVFGIRFNSRSDVDQELLEVPEEARKRTFFDRLRDEVSYLQDQVSQAELEYSMAHFLDLCESEISTLLSNIVRFSDRIEVLSRQIPRDIRNIGVCWDSHGIGVP